ncbi:Flavorubredoxin [Dehalogenimonas formicexedens]|uniref:Flavorubredoxin n=1 Tax=Dehalogenimonas formicexedens TaxID=1839801 RepID=A0A1P8F6G0_9CHLR|nr:flavodoxin domain-containing protein [Dehalogenimonas formicexedens]APV44015.1 Flavorubredoxin [Dehalogenimonas formicexedens]
MSAFTELAKGVYWVGVVDWSLRQFHGHELSTTHGTSYNSYLIIDEKCVLIDTVPIGFQSPLIENISRIIDPGKIDLIVAAHAEPDHSGALPEIMKRCPSAEVVVSPRGIETFSRHYHQPWNFRAVKTGDTYSIGQKTLTFIEAPMLHWPDNLFTYLGGDAILFSSDAFGQHYASTGRFDTDVDPDILDWETVKYYTNILNPLSPMIARKIDEVVNLKLALNMIAPSHGIIWKKDPMQIIQKYREWTEQRSVCCAVIVYDSMWQGTRLMAEAIGEGMTEVGLPFKLFNAASDDRNDILTEILLARAVVLGSPTFNQGILPTLSPVLTGMKGLKFKNKVGAAFGTWGWSGEGVGILEDHLRASQIEVTAPGVKAKWRPDPEDLEKCKELGRSVAGTCFLKE